MPPVAIDRHTSRQRTDHRDRRRNAPVAQDLAEPLAAGVRPAPPRAGPRRRRSSCRPRRRRRARARRARAADTPWRARGPRQSPWRRPAHPRSRRRARIASAQPAARRSPSGWTLSCRKFRCTASASARSMSIGGQNLAAGEGRRSVLLDKLRRADVGDQQRPWAPARAPRCTCTPGPGGATPRAGCRRPWPGQSARAARASTALTSCAAGCPPVMPAISSGAPKRWPRKVTDRSMCD